MRIVTHPMTLQVLLDVDPHFRQSYVEQHGELMGNPALVELPFRDLPPDLQQYLLKTAGPQVIYKVDFTRQWVIDHLNVPAPRGRKRPPPGQLGAVHPPGRDHGR